MWKQFVTSANITHKHKTSSLLYRWFFYSVVSNHLRAKLNVVGLAANTLAPLVVDSNNFYTTFQRDFILRKKFWYEMFNIVVEQRWKIYCKQ